MAALTNSFSLHDAHGRSARHFLCSHGHFTATSRPLHDHFTTLLKAHLRLIQTPNGPILLMLMTIIS